MFKELQRLVYQVRDVEAAAAWYGRVLDLEPAFASPVATIFRIGHGSLSLSRADTGAPAADDGRLSAYWEVDDVDRAYARLLELGARAKSPPKNLLTLRVAQVVDPFGNVLGISGRIAHDQERTVERQPSETAHGVALCRAFLARDERPSLRREDRFSELFLQDEIRALLDDPIKRRAIIDRRISPPLYGYLAARTAFVDQAFLAALDRGLSQIVFLGAGYDTRALRFANQLGSTRIFEVDAPSTQNRKRALLAAHPVDLPAQLCWVPVNFKTDDFSLCLREVGYDEAQATLFVWEGVTYYLPQETVERTLSLLHRHSAPGSALVLDYAAAKLEALHAGEPFLSWLDPHELVPWLGGLGFRVGEHLDAAALTARYLTLPDGTVAEPVLSRLRLVHAER